MKTIDAFFLPDNILASVSEWRFQDYEALRLRWPVLQPDHIKAICAHLREQRTQLLNTPVADIVAAISKTAHTLHNQLHDIAGDLSIVTGYSVPVVTQTLEHMLRDWGAASLQTMLRAELGDERMLDHAVPDSVVPGKHVAAFGYPLALHVFSGNVPGIAVTSIIRSLLAKSPTLGKAAAGEPLLPVLFARTLHAIAPHIAAGLAVTYWPGGSTQLEAAAGAEADVVVVYGGDEAVRAWSACVRPGRRLVVHGARVSFAIAGPDATRDDAAAIAQAVATYDQQGCVSPHVLYVVGDFARARSFAREVSESLAELGKDQPLGRLSAAEAVTIRNVRTAAEFSGDAELLGDDDAGFSVIVERDPAFRVSCLNRVLYIKPVASGDDVAALLPARDYLQSAGLAGFNIDDAERISRQLGLAGVTRITRFDQLPWPPMHWHHDGAAPMRELLYFQDIEG